jgi:hypothetical protein
VAIIHRTATETADLVLQPQTLSKGTNADRKNQHTQKKTSKVHSHQLTCPQTETIAFAGHGDRGNMYQNT